MFNKQLPPTPNNAKVHHKTQRQGMVKDGTRHIRDETLSLRQQVEDLQNDMRKKDEQVQLLADQNHELVEELKKQRRLVGQIADTISNAFQAYQQAAKYPSVTSSPAASANDITISYEEVLSAWSDGDSDQ